MRWALGEPWKLSLCPKRDSTINISWRYSKGAAVWKNAWGISEGDLLTNFRTYAGRAPSPGTKEMTGAISLY